MAYLHLQDGGLTPTAGIEKQEYSHIVADSYSALMAYEPERGYENLEAVCADGATYTWNGTAWAVSVINNGATYVAQHPTMRAASVRPTDILQIDRNGNRMVASAGNLTLRGGLIARRNRTEKTFTLTASSQYSPPLYPEIVIPANTFADGSGNLGFMLRAYMMCYGAGICDQFTISIWLDEIKTTINTPTSLCTTKTIATTGYTGYGFVDFSVMRNAHVGSPNFTQTISGSTNIVNSATSDNNWQNKDFYQGSGSGEIDWTVDHTLYIQTKVLGSGGGSFSTGGRSFHLEIIREL